MVDPGLSTSPNLNFIIYDLLEMSITLSEIFENFSGC